MASLVPTMNGVGGNLAAIQASRLSTALHASTARTEQASLLHPSDRTKPRTLDTYACRLPSPIRIFFRYSSIVNLFLELSL